VVVSITFSFTSPTDFPKTNLREKPQSLEDSKNLVLKVFTSRLRGYSFVFRQSASLGKL